MDFTARYGGRQQGKSFDRLVVEAMLRERERTAKATKDMVVIEEAVSIDEKTWANLPKFVGIDLGVGESWVTWTYYRDGSIHVENIGHKMLDPVVAETLEDMKPHPGKPPKRVDFFPNKIERIAKMPRYPGVWG